MFGGVELVRTRIKCEGCRQYATYLIRWDQEEGKDASAELALCDDGEVLQGYCHRRAAKAPHLDNAVQRDGT